MEISQADIEKSVKLINKIIEFKPDNRFAAIYAALHIIKRNPTLNVSQALVLAIHESEES